MSDWLSKYWFAAGLALASLVSGCDGGVGDPCVPEEEFLSDFSGFSLEQTNVESRSFQCETRICLVNHFEGRVSCPYGQKEGSLALDPADPARCRLPDGKGDPVAVEVLPQRTRRLAKDAVYCSCRCAGPDKNARYCDCPSGYGCVKLIDDLALGSGQLAGSYCIKDGTAYAPNDDPLYEPTCKRATATEPATAICGNNGQNP